MAPDGPRLPAPAASELSRDGTHWSPCTQHRGGRPVRHTRGPPGLPCASPLLAAHRLHSRISALAPPPTTRICSLWRRICTRAWRTWGLCRVGPLLARHAGETRHGGAPPGVSGGGMMPALLSTCADDPQHLPARVEHGWKGGHRARLPRRQGWSPRLLSQLGGYVESMNM